MATNSHLASKTVVEHTDEFGTVQGDADFVGLWIGIGNQMREEQDRWIAGLRTMGVKAAHPDDGWVDRKKADRHDFVQFVYPQFDDGVSQGDLIALGWPGQFRVRKVIRIETVGMFNRANYYVVCK